MKRSRSVTAIVRGATKSEKPMRPTSGYVSWVEAAIRMGGCGF
jgi:hypothetical protein